MDSGDGKTVAPAGSGNAMRSKLVFALQLLVAVAAFITALLLTVWFFMRIRIEGTTLAMDWITIRPGVDHWDLSYGLDSLLRITPWSAVLLLPLGQLPLNAGWGAIAFLTFLVLTLCIPREENDGGKWILGLLALVLSFPALRTMADGNVEFLTIGGLVLMEFGLLRKSPIVFALGILLTVSKVQEVWILVIFLPLLSGKEWNSRRWLITSGVLALVVVPSILWKGTEWFLSVFSIQDRGSIMDSSLLATVPRLGGSNAAALVLWIVVFGLVMTAGVWLIRGFSREALGFLTAGSLLLAPYAAGNNLLIVYAIGVMPLLLSRRWEGVLLAAWINLPYLVLPFREVNYRYSATYWTLVLGLAVVLFGLRLMRKREQITSAAKRTAVTGAAPSLEEGGSHDAVPGC
jgi:uncharacterized membrane protein